MDGQARHAMRLGFGLIGLIVVLGIVAVLSKKQLGAVSTVKVPEVPGAVLATPDPNATVKQQSQQIQQQLKQAAESAMQQTRPEGDNPEAK